MDHEKRNQPSNQSAGNPGAQSSQEKNLREGSLPQRSDMDYESFPEPVSFANEPDQSMVEDEDLDRIERDDPKADDADDIKDSR